MKVFGLIYKKGASYYYHVARASDLPSILKSGLLPYTPTDMENEDEGVYLFKDRIAVEDALMNWLGDKFDEDEELVLLTISPVGIKMQPSVADYEIISKSVIPPQKIVKIEEI